MCTCTSEWIGDYCEWNASVAVQETAATGPDADEGMSYVSRTCKMCFYHMKLS